MANEAVDLIVVQWQGGLAVYLQGVRIAGPKPPRGTRPTRAFTVPREVIAQALT